MIHDSHARQVVRRGCVVLAGFAAAWTLIALLSRGISFDLGPLHVSSRNPRNPALVALLTIVIAWALADPDDRHRQLQLDVSWIWASACRAASGGWRAWTRSTAWLDTNVPPAAAPICALAIAGAIIVTALKESQFVAAASDAWGYVGHAHMWATWTLRTPEPLMAQLREFLPPDAMAPLAFRPGPDSASIVPVTSPGLPMLMGLFETAGGQDAVFAVVPLLAALAVWATYMLGRDFKGRWTGVVAAVLLATSPAFLFQLTSGPMSDIPAAAFWTLSLAWALRGRTAGPGVSRAACMLTSGIMAGLAILIRANLAPVAIVPAAIVLMGPPSTFALHCAGPAALGPAHGNVGSRYGILWFGIGVVPGAVIIAILYTYWYGSPLNSGYGTLKQLYSTANLVPNVTRYSRWLLESQTPVVLLALIAWGLVSDRRAAVALLAFACAVGACYVFYLPFDAWWFLRFLLPAFPALLVLTAAALMSAARRLPPQARAIATVVVLGLIVNHTIAYAAARATFDSGGEQKYAVTGRYVATHLPEKAVLISEIHSGSLRYYSHRPTIRFGSIPPDHIEGAVAELRRLGYLPYLVAEDWEEEAFRKQFAGRRIIDLLANGPDVELPLGHVRIYPLAR
jgi:hypothetical protein